MSEFRLIKDYFTHPTHDSSIVLGVGDDCAVIAPPADERLVICTDTLVQGRHFAADWADVERLAFEIGYKSVAVNLSDIASMGAYPHSILLAIALPDRLANDTWLSAFAKGLNFALDNTHPDKQVHLIGGDTTKSEQLVITVTAQGFTKSAVYRHGAKAGDMLYLSGTVGDAAYALAHPDSPLIHRLHLPTARSALGMSLSGVASSMIDVSDGLAQDLGHILSASGVGAHLYLDKLPTSDTLSQIDLATRLKFQLTGGDDYELLFTLPKGITPPISNTPATPIGKIVADSGLSLLYQGQKLTVDNPAPFTTYPNLAGWSHF